MLEALRSLKPSRWFLVGLILVALGTLGGVMLGYVPSVIGHLEPPEYADFVASVFGVVATVVGVAVAGWVTLEQLDSEREDRSKERQLATKHAVLIDALRGFKEMTFQITQLSNVETPYAQIQNAFNTAHAQVTPAWAVADLPTVSLLQQLTNDVSSTFMRLGVERYPILKMFERGTSLYQSMMKLQTLVNEMSQAQSDAAATADFVKATQLAQLIGVQNKNLSKVKSQYEAAYVEFGEAHTPYALQCIFEVRRIVELYRELMGCVRLEVHAAAKDETFEDFCDAADLEDAMMVGRIKEAFHEKHHALIEKLARDAGCQVA